MSNVTVHQIHKFAQEAVANSSFIGNGRHFRAADKKKMMILIQNSGITQDTVAAYLSGVGNDGHLKWAGRFFHWVIAMRDGTLDAQISAELGNPAQTQEALPFKAQGEQVVSKVVKPFKERLKEMIQEELKADVSIHAVGVIVSAAFKECRENALDAAREEVMRSLKKKGLTLDDIAI